MPSELPQSPTAPEDPTAEPREGEGVVKRQLNKSARESEDTTTSATASDVDAKDTQQEQHVPDDARDMRDDHGGRP